MMVLLGDFNAKCTNQYKHIKKKKKFEVIAIENNSSQYGLYQVINKPTPILKNSSSCIDLIFTSQPNLTTELGVHPSLHPNCHKEVIYTKISLKVHYPPPNEREVWHYKEANKIIKLINKVIKKRTLILFVDQLKYQIETE